MIWGEPGTCYFSLSIDFISYLSLTIIKEANEILLEQILS